MKIEDRLVGDKQPVLMVAELSANHMQRYETAVKTIEAAKQAGADAVKVQTYTPKTITYNRNKRYFRLNEGLWKGETLYSLYKKGYMPWHWQWKLKKITQKLGLIFFSTPFDKSAVDFLEKIGLPAYKIASYEINDIPLVEYVASMRKPVFISTGLAKFSEIKEAVKACRRKNNKEIVLLKCTSSYPTPLEEVNLNILPDLKKKFKTLVGLSDHTKGITTAIAGVALGAKVIEKHFILSRRLKTLDRDFSLEPEEFYQMVKAVRETEKSLGTTSYKLSDTIKKERRLMRSLFVVKNIKKGEKFTEEKVRSIRPNFGLAPKYLEKIIGRKAKKNIKSGSPLKWSLIN